VDAASHRVLEEFVREVTAPERDELVRLSLAVKQIEARLGMRPKPKRPPRRSRRAGHEARERRRREVAKLADSGLTMTAIAERLGCGRSPVKADLAAASPDPVRSAMTQNGSRPRNATRPAPDHPWRPRGGLASPA
jgi:DNA-binding NarL/FixJ family response regulator